MICIHSIDQWKNRIYKHMFLKQLKQDICVKCCCEVDVSMPAHFMPAYFLPSSSNRLGECAWVCVWVSVAGGRVAVGVLGAHLFLACLDTLSQISRVCFSTQMDRPTFACLFFQAISSHRPDSVITIMLHEPYHVTQSSCRIHCHVHCTYRRHSKHCSKAFGRLVTR